MKDKVVYLCGPINGCTDSECKDWREYAKKRLPQTLDPMRRDYRGKEVDSSRAIVELDKIDVASSDVLLVYYDKPSVGTSMEILYAWERGKTVVIALSRPMNISPWLEYHAHHVAESIDGAIEWILALN